MDKKQIQQKIKMLEKNKNFIEAKIKKLKKRLNELENNSATKKGLRESTTIENKEQYYTDAAQRKGKTKIAIYSPTKDIKKAKKIDNCNTQQAEFLAIQWAYEHAKLNPQKTIIYNDNTEAIKKAQKEFKEYENIEFLWIPRKENKIADKLARI